MDSQLLFEWPLTAERGRTDPDTQPQVQPL